MYKTRWTDADFQNLKWHDNHVHGLAIREGKDGAGQLILDLDHIVEWRRVADKTFSFMVAPAELVFDEVTDLKIGIDCHGFATGPLPISEIHRDPLDVTGGFRRYRWRITFSRPDGEIGFEASGFVQELRAPPLESARQCLRWVQRQPRNTPEPRS